MESTKKFPKYIKSYDGYIGVFNYLDFGEFQVYRFDGGERIADRLEIQNGCDDYQEMKNRLSERSTSC